MSFDFSDLVIPDADDDVNENVDNYTNYDYTQFLTEPIYDWLNSPEEILQVCDDIEEERKKKRKVTIIQQAQTLNTVTYKKVLYRRGPYRKRNSKNN
jgi:hypothetical protein